MTSRRVLSASLALAAAAVAVACGDLYADPIVEEIVEPAAFDAATLDPQNVEQPCPASRPSENAPCSPLGMTCEYGTSPDMRCNAILSCAPYFGVASWEGRSREVCSRKACPDRSVAELDGTPCTLPEGDPDAGPPRDADELVCSVEGGTCACTTGRDGAHAHERRWSCVKPSGDCPVHRPLAGQACGAPRWCDYGSCAFKRGLRMECAGGVWLTGGASCS
jgi:hypothetical protein